jgi:hypothetical protein
MGKDSCEQVVVSGTSKRRRQAGASTNPQDGERRVETLLKKLAEVASALRREEIKGNVTSFIIGVVRADVLFPLTRAKIWSSGIGTNLKTCSMKLTAASGPLKGGDKRRFSSLANSIHLTQQDWTSSMLGICGAC